MMTLTKLADVVNGELFGDDLELSSLGGLVCTDTRTMSKGRIYLALSGPNFDGNDFAEAAMQKGALALIVQRYFSNLNVAQIVVGNGLHALSALAAFYRRSLTAKVCAITGSTGKTTVKGMLKSICDSAFCRSSLNDQRDCKGIHLDHLVTATNKNLNNHIGVPLTLLSAHPGCEYLIVEAGMSHPGEIAPLAEIIDPNVAIVNNVGPSHIEAFGQLKGIAQEKSEIYMHSSTSPVCVMNSDDEFYSFFQERCKGHYDSAKIMSFSLGDDASVNIFADDIVLDELGRASFSLVDRQSKQSVGIKLSVLGSHNVNNALAAATCAIAMDVKLENIQCGLNEFLGEPGRMQCIEYGDHTLIHDAYNANPESMKAAIRFLARLPNAVLVLGDMGELGDFANAAHTGIASFAKSQGIKNFYVCGNHSDDYALGFGKSIRSCTSHEAIARAIIDDQMYGKISKKSTILIKGSRSSKMENVISHLKQYKESH